MGHADRAERPERAEQAERLDAIALAAAGLLLLFLAGCSAGTPASPESPSSTPASPAEMISPSAAPEEGDAMAKVNVRVFDNSGELVGPISMPKVVKSDAEWRAQLSPAQFEIARGKGTERPFCGTLLDNKKEGVYTCVCCDLPLFESGSKFDSGTGWPSFFRPIAAENVAEKHDDSHGMRRTEILCARCDGHLGHVFDDGPRPTGLRYCLNSESLEFTAKADLRSLADPRATAGAAGAAPAAARATVVFAGGCFWCVEAVFEELDGVIDAVSGYAGGSKETANYEAVCSGTTGHAEAVQIVYDPARIGLEKLLEVHFATHDPTTKDRQGNDVGPQYRSALFYRDEAEKKKMQAFLEAFAAKTHLRAPVVTTLEPLREFFPAEAYHQNYACRNPNQGYIQAVAQPKVEKVRQKFTDALKPGAKP